MSVKRGHLQFIVNFLDDFRVYMPEDRLIQAETSNMHVRVIN
jgi:hypothetical protein